MASTLKVAREDTGWVGALVKSPLQKT